MEGLGIHRLTVYGPLGLTTAVTEAHATGAFSMRVVATLPSHVHT